MHAHSPPDRCPQSPERGRFGSSAEQLVELAGVVKVKKVVASADMMHAIQALGDVRAPFRALDHDPARFAAIIDRDLAILDAFRLEQLLGAPAIRAECLGVDLDSHNPSFTRILRQEVQRINSKGFTTRAQLTSSTRAAPARLSVRAQTSAVLPVVSTSSISITVFPATFCLSRTLKAPATVLRRCSGLMPLSGGVLRVRASASGSVAMPRRRDSSRATSADWLKPLPHSRVRWSGTGTRIRSDPSPTSGAI